MLSLGVFRVQEGAIQVGTGRVRRYSRNMISCEKRTHLSPLHHGGRCPLQWSPHASPRALCTSCVLYKRSSKNAGEKEDRPRALPDELFCLYSVGIWVGSG